MRRATIIERGRGTAGAWRIDRDVPADPFRPLVTLVHHATPMLRWNPRCPAEDHEILSLGWGSVSDQSGMNEAFRVLGLPYRYSRAGGAEIIELVRDPATGCLVHPDHLKRPRRPKPSSGASTAAAATAEELGAIPTAALDGVTAAERAALPGWALIQLAAIRGLSEVSR